MLRPTVKRVRMGRLIAISSLLTAVGTCTLAGVTIWGIFLSDFGEVLVRQLRSDIADAHEELISLRTERRILEQSIEVTKQEKSALEIDIEEIVKEKETLNNQKAYLEKEKDRIIEIIYTEYVFEMSQCLSMDLVFIEVGINKILDKEKKDKKESGRYIEKLKNIDGWDIVLSLLSNAPRPYLYDLVHAEILSDAVDFMVRQGEVFFDPIWPEGLDVSDLPEDVAHLLIEGSTITAETETVLKGIRAMGNLRRLESALEQLLMTIHPAREPFPIISAREVGNNLIQSRFCIARGLRKAIEDAILD